MNIANSPITPSVLRGSDWFTKIIYKTIVLSSEMMLSTAVPLVLCHIVCRVLFSGIITLNSMRSTQAYIHKPVHSIRKHQVFSVFLTTGQPTRLAVFLRWRQGLSVRSIGPFSSVHSDWRSFRAHYGGEIGFSLSGKLQVMRHLKPSTTLLLKLKRTPPTYLSV